LPEEWLIERIQQVGAISCNLLSPSFIVVCGLFAAVFRTLRDIFVTDAISNYAAWNAIVPRLTVVSWAPPCTATWAATGLLPTSPPFPFALPSVQEASSDHEQDSGRALTQLQ